MGIDVNVRDSGGRTPLMWAIMGPWSSSPLTAVYFESSRYGSDSKNQLSTTAVDGLLNAGANIDDFDCSQRTALHWAAAVGRNDIAKLLIDRGGSIHAVD
jgi:ankyrin repeat protein